MKYLDEDIEFSFRGVGIVQYRTYNYTLSVKNSLISDTWTTIFVGSFFKVDNIPTSTINCTDIIRDYKWDSAIAFSTPYSTLKGYPADLVLRFKVTIDVQGTPHSTEETVAMIYRYPHTMNKLNSGVFDIYTQTPAGYYLTMLQGIEWNPSVPADELILVPEVPFILSDNYGVGLVMETDNNLANTNFQLIKDNKVLKTLSYTIQKGIHCNFWSLRELFSGLTEVPQFVRYNIGSTKNIFVRVNKDCPHITESTDITSEIYVDDTESLGVDIDISQAGLGFVATKVANPLSKGRIIFYDNDYTELYSEDFDISKDSFEVSYQLRSEFFEVLSYIEIQIIDSADDYGYVLYTHDYRIPNDEIVTVKGNLLSIGTTSTTINDLKFVLGEDKEDKSNLKPSRYYLQWQDRFGGFQSQPFNGKSTFKEEFNRLNIQDYKGKKRMIDVEVKPSWELNTSWVDVDLYPLYESIFVSPYLMLYDVEEDKSYNVILTNKNYNEESWKNNKKMYNLTLNVEKDINQNIRL